MNKLETLIQEGKELFQKIKFVEPPRNVIRTNNEKIGYY